MKQRRGHSRWRDDMRMPSDRKENGFKIQMFVWLQYKEGKKGMR